MKNYFNLVLYLNFIFILSGGSYASSKKEYHSKPWLKLLYYQKNNAGNYISDVEGEFFFISSKGKKSPKLEWESSLKAIENNEKVGRLKIPFACAFPARFQLLKEHVKKQQDYTCEDLTFWRESIGAKELYLVYASSYVSNPASLFGHSFLRFSKGGKSRSSALLDYSIGFMALTNPNDNSLMYSIKGITGQYMGHFEVKPFYMNVGLYQNSEDRDLWQYKVKLDLKDVSFLVDHMWEMSQNAMFKYYFFDENCSFFLLRTLEAIKPEWNLTEQNYLFAHPIETMKWVQQKLEKTPIHIPSINKKLRQQITKMSGEEKRLFSAGKSDLKSVRQMKSVPVLDALIDYWKHENYAYQAKLPLRKREIMDGVLDRRSELGESQFVYREMTGDQEPLSFHDPNKIEVSYEEKSEESIYHFNYSLGYHDFDDNFSGHDHFSYIDYLGLSLSFENDEVQYDNFNIVSINSMAPFLLHLPKFSWVIDIKHQRENIFLNRQSITLEGGLGITHFYNRNFISVLLKAEGIVNNSLSYFVPQLSLRFRNLFETVSVNQNINFAWFKSKIRLSYEVRFNYFYLSNSSVFLEFKNLRGVQDEFSSSAGLRFNL
jgi:hypothetical protein